MIEIDGGYLEGGGEILRTACALSAVTKKPCRVFNIRQGRPEPGLATQHLLGLQALAQLCRGELAGDFLGSTEITFFPGEIDGGSASITASIDLPTAGSITLILQTLVLPCLFSQKPVKIVFKGGATDTFFSPTIDYFKYVFLKILEKMGVKVEVNILKRGCYPEGGAKVETIVQPSKLKNLKITERGNFKRILIISGASESLKDKKAAERQVSGAKEIMRKLKLPTEEKIEYSPTQSPGSHINLVAEFENTIIGTDNLGKLGKKAEEVGREAALNLLKEEKTGSCLDSHMADQILPYLALSSGKSEVTVSEITNHCKTNIWVIEKFFDGKFKIRDNLIIWNPS